MTQRRINFLHAYGHFKRFEGRRNKNQLGVIFVVQAFKLLVPDEIASFRHGKGKFVHNLLLPVFKPQITVHVVEQVGKSVPLDIFKACGQLETLDKTYGLKRARFYCFKPLLNIHGFKAAVAAKSLRLDGAVARRNEQFFYRSIIKASFGDFSYRLAFVRFGQRQLARQRIRLFCRYGVSLAVLCFLKDKVALVGGSVNVLGSHRQIFRYSFQSRRGQIPADKFVCKVSVGRVGGRYGVAQIRHLFGFKRLAFVVKKLDG